MNDNNELPEKLRAYRTLTVIIAVVIAFTLGMLGWMLPGGTVYIPIMLGGLALFSLYLIVLCLRLIRELKETLKK